jgi:hypothetical protein
VPARGCTRSRAVEFASEDLKFLEDYSAGNVSTHVDGKVWFQPDGSDDDEEKRVPLKGVKVTLLGGTTPPLGKIDSVWPICNRERSALNLQPSSGTRRLQPRMGAGVDQRRSEWLR